MDALLVVSEEGFWAEECCRPMETLRENDYSITVATPTGGVPIVDDSSTDPNEVGEDTAREMGAMIAADEDLNAPISLAEAVNQDFDVVVFPGGHGTMFDINHDHHAHRILRDAVNQRKALVICHAVGLLGFTRHEDGSHLVDGKTVTGFPNEWEDDIVMDGELLPNGMKLPYRVEDVVKRAGGNWDAELGQDTSVQVDGNLITARGPESSTAGVNRLLDEMEDTAAQQAPA